MKLLIYQELQQRLHNDISCLQKFCIITEDLILTAWVCRYYRYMCVAILSGQTLLDFHYYKPNYLHSGLNMIVFRNRI